MAHSDWGNIGLCPHRGCRFTCCDFAAGNYIVLAPGELALAQEAGHSVAHLQIEPTEHGGHRAICRARSPANCDHGYKPRDCASYPFFPTVDDHDVITAELKGAKCPLQPADIVAHRQWVADLWASLAVADPTLILWIRQTRLVGYQRIP